MYTYTIILLIAEQDKLSDGLKYVRNSCLYGEEMYEAERKIIARLKDIQNSIKALRELNEIYL